MLLLGSSRMATFTFSGNLATVAQKLTGDTSLEVFNAAIPSGDPITMHFLATKILEAGGAPRLAILEINPDFLSSDNMFLTFTIKRQFVAADIPPSIHDILFSSGEKTFPVSPRRGLTPFYRHRTTLLDWLESSFGITPEVPPTMLASIPQNTPRATGDEPQTDTKPATQPPASLIARSQVGAAIYGRSLRHYKLQGYTSQELEATVAMLSKKGIKVVLVRTPLSTPLRAP